MKKAVIFDCDGVLINSEEVAERAETALFEEYGLVYSRADRLELFSGVSYEDFIIRLNLDYRQRRGQPLPSDFEKRLKTTYRVIEETCLRAYEGVPELLSSLQTARVPFCVASNASRVKLTQRLQLTNLAGYFNKRAFSKTDVQNPKPAPDIYLFAAHRLDIQPAECVVVEDSSTGVRAAVTAGMYVIGYTGGEHRCATEESERLRAAGAEDTACTMAELKGKVFRLLEKAPAP